MAIKTGTNGNDIINGTDFDDTLVGGKGNDSLVGGEGNDIYIFNLGDGQDVLDNRDYAEGSGWADYIDVLVFGEGILPENVSFNYDHTVSKSDLVIRIKNTTDSITLSGLFDMTDSLVEYINFKNGVTWTDLDIRGIGVNIQGDNNNLIYGTYFKNRIFGFAGDDVIYGDTENLMSGTNDTINGGMGNDTLHGGIGNDIYQYQRGDGFDTVVNRAFDEFHDNGGGLSYGNTANDSIEFLDIKSNQVSFTRKGLDLFINILGENAGIKVERHFDKLWGEEASSPDTIDNIQFSDGIVLKIEDTLLVAKEGIDTVVEAFSNRTLEANIENLKLLGDLNINGTGNSLNNLLTGNSGNNVLDSSIGNDTLIGSLGDDTYVVDSVGDVVTEKANEGLDSIQSSVTYTLTGNIENLTLTGTNAINGTGNSLNNVIKGNDGDNTLDGGLGADTLRGGKGNDTYIVDDINDVVEEVDVRTVIRVNTDSLGQQANNSGDNAVFSPDGNKVLFTSYASNLVAGDNDYSLDFFVKDLRTGVVISVNSDSFGKHGNNGIEDAVFSPDGNKILFRSYVNLVADDTDGDVDIYVKDLRTGIVTCVNTDSLGNQVKGTSYNAFFSPDGNKVLFNSNDDYLVAGDTNNSSDVFIKDLRTGVVTRVSTGSFGQQANGWSNNITSFSPDGNKVLFKSNANNLVAGDNDDYFDIFAKDLRTGVVTRVNTDSLGKKMNADIYDAIFSPDSNTVLFESRAVGDTSGVIDIFAKDLGTGVVTYVYTDSIASQGLIFPYQDFDLSPDGTKVLFTTYTTNLVAGDTNGVNDVYVKDLRTGVVTRVSTDNLGQQGNSASYNGVFSPDGNKVLFMSSANNLVAGDTNGVDDVFVKDLRTGVVTCVNTNSLGQQGNGASYSYKASFSPDGKKVLFISDADNLVAGDINGYNDFFVKDLGTGVVTSVTADRHRGEQTNGYSNHAVFSSDGKKVLFMSGANNLVAGDTNEYADIFVKSLVEDVVQASVSYTLTANVEDLILTGANSINGTGNTLNNVLTGNSGNNVLDGSIGNDTLIGGLGDDTYIVDAVGDVVAEIANEGLDSVQSSITYTLTANVENLTLTGSNAINGAGNTLNNLLTGNSGNNVLNGSTGNDTLIGGLGADTYQFKLGDGQDYIEQTESNSQDIIQFASGINLENITLQRLNSTDLKLSYSTTDAIDIKGFFTNTRVAINQYQLADGAIKSYLDVLIAYMKKQGAIISGTNKATIKEATTLGLLKTQGKLDISFASLGASFSTEVVATTGVLGTLQINAEGVWTYQVENSALLALKSGETRTEKFTVKAIDGSSTQIDISLVGIETPPVNQLPTQSISIKSGETLSFVQPIIIQTKDIDAATVKVKLNAAHGILQLGMTKDVSVEGNQSESLQLTGTVTAVNNSLQSLILKTIEGYHGQSQLTITTEDIQGKGLDADIFTFVIQPKNQGEQKLGTAQNDTLVGGIKDDKIQGGDGKDALVGLSGEDVLDGGIGNDVLSGGLGADYLMGGVDDDVLLGGRQDDVLIGGLGADYLSGGLGNDRYIFEQSFGKDILRDVAGVDRAIFNQTNINDLWFEQKDQDLVITALSTQSQLTIKNWSLGHHIEAISANGKNLLDTRVAALVQVMSSLNQGNVPSSYSNLSSNDKSVLDNALSVAWLA